MTYAEEMTMEFQFEDRGAMTFQFLSGGDVFATVHALRVAADRWVDGSATDLSHFLWR
jgi:hypothetical protein